MEPGKRTASQAIDGPVEEIETEGQKHLQALLKKQLNTNLSLKQHLQQKKEFSSSVTYRPGVEEISGVVTLSDYQTLEKTDSFIEEMKGYGLTEEEILFKIQHEETEASAAKRRRLTNPEHEQTRLSEIEKKIQTKKETLSKPDAFSDTKTISRHEMQLEKSISQSSQSSKFLHGVLIKEKPKNITTNPADPMNNIDNIYETLTYKPFKRRTKKHGKDDTYKLGCTLECCIKTDEICQTPSDKSCEKCQSMGMGCPLEHRELPVATCMEKPADYDTRDCKECDPVPIENNYQIDTNGQNQNSSTTGRVDPSVPISDEDIESIPEHVIKSYKLSAEEIKKLPRFENYESGQPNNVLFLKNLSAKVTREDLVALFNRYQTRAGDIQYKLMTGRMKGQAFITFQNLKTATKALELVHGYDFKGKPIIIVYGKKTNKS